MRVISVVGARPEFIQAAPVSRALREAGHQEILVHTGQHYDFLMSQTFFNELGIAAPDYNLEAGSGSHAQQTGEILIRIERVILETRPDAVIVRGDTNSTLGAALAASKLAVPIAHIEAGERSFDKTMPEEINRIVSDQLASWHFCASRAALANLAREGIGPAYWVGDVMLDAMRQHCRLALSKSDILTRLTLAPGKYTLATIHRAANTDNPARLKQIVTIFNSASETIVFPVHPRTRKALREIGARFAPHVKAIEPVGYFDMIALEHGARMIATDSGGVQREAYFLGKPCLTLRDKTEWSETVASGWNKLVGVDIAQALDSWFFTPPVEQPPIFGTGRAASRIVEILGAAPSSRQV